MFLDALADARRGLPACLVLCAWLVCACGHSYDACQKDQITGSEHCSRTSGDYGNAAATAAVAGAGWAAVGCTVNGCDPTHHCNEKTKMCERIQCEEGRGSCPSGYTCDPVDKVCK